MRTRKKNPKGRDEKAPLESGTEWKGKEDIFCKKKRTFRGPMLVRELYRERKKQGPAETTKCKKKVALCSSGIVPRGRLNRRWKRR